jgi:hypothetical protein
MQAEEKIAFRLVEVFRDESLSFDIPLLVEISSRDGCTIQFNDQLIVERYPD